MAINMNYKQFRRTMTEQRSRLRKMAGEVEDDLYEGIRDVHLPQLVQDVTEATPILTGKLVEHGITYKLTRNKKREVSLTVTAKAYNKGYNYAYIQHENEDFSHEHGSHHYVSGPFERMLEDIAAVEGLDYIPPEDSSRVYGSGGNLESWLAAFESDKE